MKIFVHREDEVPYWGASCVTGAFRRGARHVMWSAPANRAASADVSSGGVGWEGVILLFFYKTLMAFQSINQSILFIHNLINTWQIDFISWWITIFMMYYTVFGVTESCAVWDENYGWCGHGKIWGSKILDVNRVIHEWSEVCINWAGHDEWVSVWKGSQASYHESFWRWRH